MFYFILSTILTYNWLLVAAAVIPAIFLMVKVYQSDRMEKESGQLLRSLAVAGVLSSLLALVEERVLSGLLNALIPPYTMLYGILLYFGIVAIAEESSKYLFLRKRTWKNPEFNCQYDGVVYAVFVSLGFALWENISYVMNYGFAAAIVRALTAIPGHACFGVYMGVFYGIAKKYQSTGDEGRSRVYRALSVIVPALLHGAYDYIASYRQVSGSWGFLIFVVLLFAVTFLLVGRAAAADRYID